MEQEVFLSGYCRQLDGSRMVEVIFEGSKLEEADCCYGSCAYQANCIIAQRIEELIQG